MRVIKSIRSPGGKGIEDIVDIGTIGPGIVWIAGGYKNLHDTKLEIVIKFKIVIGEHVVDDGHIVVFDICDTAIIIEHTEVIGECDLDDFACACAVSVMVIV